MYRTAYRTVDVDGLSVFYREAGLPDAPTAWQDWLREHQRAP
ncbi:MAG: hypothetical protein ACLPKE_23290 [Streptosporangiaceae bacterium]